jgi:hypothetical protein
MADLVVGDVLRDFEFAVVLPGKDRAINRLIEPVYSLKMTNRSPLT